MIVSVWVLTPGPPGPTPPVDVGGLGDPPVGNGGFGDPVPPANGGIGEPVWAKADPAQAARRTVASARIVCDPNHPQRSQIRFSIAERLERR